MKKCTLLVVMFLVIAGNIFAQSNRTAQTNDVNPLSSTLKSGNPANSIEAVGDLLRNYNIDSLTPPAVGGYGVVWTGSNFIVSEFNANLYYRFTANWVKRDSFAITGATGLFRDMCFAKGLLWGVNTTNQIFGIDTGTKAVVKTITCTGAATLRALAWDPYRNGFWVGTTSFTGPLVCVDTNGVNIVGASITTPASGLYGAGYENNGSQATSFIWISTDASPANATQTSLVKYNAQTLAVVAPTLTITVPLQTPAATLASGGGEVVTNLIPGKKTWVGVVQSNPDRVIVVDLGDLPVPPPVTTLVLCHDTVSGLATATKPNRDSLVKYLPSLISGFDVATFDTNSALPSLTNYKTIIVAEVAFNTLVTRYLGRTARVNLMNWLNSGTPGNKKNLILLGGDEAYNYQRTGSAGLDADFANTLGIIYRVDDASGTQKTVFNVSTPAVTDSLSNGVQYYPDGASVTNGAVALLGYLGHTGTDTLSAIGRVSANYNVATAFQDPRYYQNIGGSASNSLGRGLRRTLATLLAFCNSNSGGITVIPTLNSTVAKNYTLSQNYPNPFNPSTIISFAIPQNGFVSLKIYDLAGKEMTTLLSRNMTTGNYSVEFNAAALSSGVYFYRLESGNFVETKKMMLVK